MSYLTLSFSSMKEFSKSPAHFLHYKNKTRTPSTPAQTLGKLVHTMLLEPAEVTARYAVAPKVNRATTLGKQAWEKFTFENPNKEHIPADMMATAQETRDAVMRHEEAADLIAGATHYELHVEGEIHGLDFHGYVDALDGEQGHPYGPQDMPRPQRQCLQPHGSAEQVLPAGGHLRGADWPQCLPPHRGRERGTALRGSLPAL